VAAALGRLQRAARAGETALPQAVTAASWHLGFIVRSHDV
jgi:hypothetical protein